MFEHFEIMLLVSHIQIGMTAKGQSVSNCSVSLSPTFAVTTSVFISEKPCVPATDMTDSLPFNRSKKAKLWSINDTVDPVSQSAIVSTHPLSLPIGMGISCKNPLFPVESIEELPVLFWDLGSLELLSFSDFSKTTCNIRLCFLVHPLTPHTFVPTCNP